MLKLYFIDYSLLLPFLFLFIFVWVFFFKVNFFSVYDKVILSDRMNHINTKRFIHSSFFLIINEYLLILLVLYFVSLNDYSHNFWWNHFKITSWSFFFILILLFVNTVFIIVVRVFKYTLSLLKSDYFFALANLSIFLPIIFLINTFFTFFFILEVISALVLYKFIVSRSWLYRSDSTKITDKLFSPRDKLPREYLNTLFFQYWATFFSSVLLVFLLIFYFFSYGSTEWSVINLLNKTTTSTYFVSLFIANALVCSIFIFAFLIKIGFTPLQLYKVEVYKGLPYMAIFFYTTFYFLVFFLFFVLILLFYLSSFSIYWLYLLGIIILVGGIYLISLLFDINYIKVFFAYSTTVNSLGFLILIFAVLS